MNRVPLRVVSPHLDDAVLSCALLLTAHPGSSVTTVFAGGPPVVDPLPPWDRASHRFKNGDDVMGTRRREDSNATELLHATSEHLEYWDSQYRSATYGYSGPGPDTLAGHIADDLSRLARQRPASAWLFPLGLGHGDHRLAAEAGLLFFTRQSDAIYVYEELPYALELPVEVQERRSALVGRHMTLLPAPELNMSDDRRRKRAAIHCHTSQRRALRRRARIAVRAEERVWRLVIR